MSRTRSPHSNSLQLCNLIEGSVLKDTTCPQGMSKEISIATFDVGSSRGARWLLFRTVCARLIQLRQRPRVMNEISDWQTGLTWILHYVPTKMLELFC